MGAKRRLLRQVRMKKEITKKILSAYFIMRGTDVDKPEVKKDLQSKLCLTFTTFFLQRDRCHIYRKQRESLEQHENFSAPFSLYKPFDFCMFLHTMT